MHASNLKMSLIFIVLMMLLFGNVSVYAESCTYSEAVMAIKQGNTVRGTALLKMAANDGDQRAIRFLKQRKESNGLSIMAMLVQDRSIAVIIP